MLLALAHRGLLGGTRTSCHSLAVIQRQYFSLAGRESDLWNSSG